VSHWELFYHLVWATRKRHPPIDDRIEVVLQRSFRATCHEFGTVVHAIGTMPDHVRLAVSIPPRHAIADVVRQLKGSAAHLVNHSDARLSLDTFSWQAEYGVRSLGERSLPDVVAYVENQRAHHAAGRIRSGDEISERPYTPTPVPSPGGTSSVQRGRWPSAPRFPRARSPVSSLHQGAVRFRERRPVI